MIFIHPCWGAYPPLYLVEPNELAARLVFVFLANETKIGLSPLHTGPLHTFFNRRFLLTKTRQMPWTTPPTPSPACPTPEDLLALLSPAELAALEARWWALTH
jgi:hypothetical protein